MSSVVNLTGLATEKATTSHRGHFKVSGVLREDNRHRKRLLFGCRRALPEFRFIHPSELRSCREPLTRPRPAMLRQSPPATITSLDNAPQSKLRSSAQGLLRLLCDSDAQNQPGFYVRDKKTAVRDADSGLGSGGRRSRTDDPLLAKQML